MKNTLLKVFTFAILAFNSTGALASLITSTKLSDYAAIAAGALVIDADAVVSGNLGAGAAVSVGAGASTKNIYSGAAISMGANTSAKDLNGAAAVTIGAGSTYTSLKNKNLDMSNAIKQIIEAQLSLYSIKNNYTLDATMGNKTFTAGVYKGAALTSSANSIVTLDGNGEINPMWIFNLSAAFSVGANNTFKIINSGKNASVIWNLGGALTLGAGTSFLGTAFVDGAISGGAGSSISCGNLYSKAAISIGSITSSDCVGSYNSLDYDFDVTTSKSRFPSSVSGPSTALMIFSALVLLFLNYSRLSRSKVNRI